MKKRDFAGFVVGIGAGAALTFASSPSAFPNNQASNRKLPAAASPSAIPAPGPKAATSPAVEGPRLNNGTDPDNDSVLLISDASGFESRAEEIAKLSTETLRKWVRTDPSVALPWLIHHAKLLPMGMIAPKIGKENIMSDPAIQREFLKCRELGDPVIEEFLKGWIFMDQALAGKPENLGLSPEQATEFSKQKTAAAKLSWLAGTTALPVDLRSSALNQLALCDPAAYVKFSGTILPELRGEEKAPMIRQLAKFYEKGDADPAQFRSALLDYQRQTNKPADGTTVNSLISIAKTGGVSEALDLMPGMMERADLKDENLQMLLYPLMMTDPGGGSEWLNSQPPGRLKNAAIQCLVWTLPSDPDTAAAWIRQSTDAAWREEALKNLQGAKTKP